jgi:hypothetical protein
MKLFLSGKKDVSYRQLPPSIIKIIKALEASKDGELFLSQQAAGLGGVNREYILRNIHHMSGYTHLVGSKRYWGKRNTIKQLIKETKNQ